MSGLAHDRILAWVRSDAAKRACDAIVGMRVQYKTERKLVLALDRTEAKPGSSWERQDVIFANGATWEECAEQLEAKGLLPREVKP